MLLLVDQAPGEGHGNPLSRSKQIKNGKKKIVQLRLLVNLYFRTSATSHLVSKMSLQLLAFICLQELEHSTWPLESRQVEAITSLRSKPPAALLGSASLAGARREGTTRVRRTFPRRLWNSHPLPTHGPALLLGDRYQPARSGRRSRPTGAGHPGSPRRGLGRQPGGADTGARRAAAGASSPLAPASSPSPGGRARAGRERGGGVRAAAARPGGSRGRGARRSERTSPRRARRSSPAAAPARRRPRSRTRAREGRGRPRAVPARLPAPRRPRAPPGRRGGRDPRRPRTREAGSRGRPQPEGIARDRRSSPRHPPPETWNADSRGGAHDYIFRES
ncbi:uncharacterized protein DKFZp434B061-like isoform X2 [Ovis canadensis]|uniref:uncharacterized protein DKFZp434B061-like isoform X2 n=1 Tax=Ovis canadensis TaxID=37174 RepID=UPI0037515265